MLPNGRKSYVYNFVDHASRWEFKRAYDSFGPSETKDFAERVIKKAPFSIVRWKIGNNGIEFTFKYVSHVDKPRKHALDRWCEKNGIRHVLIPPGEKELQGLVERSHRMDEDELYHRIKPKDLCELNRFLEAHCDWKNQRRRRKALGWKSPIEWLSEYFQCNKEQLLGSIRFVEDSAVVNCGKNTLKKAYGNFQNVTKLFESNGAKQNFLPGNNEEVQKQSAEHLKNAA